jgi:hypothetical protein
MSRYKFATNRARRHAHDEGSRDLSGAYQHMYRAMDHLVGARDGKVEFDQDHFDENVKKAYDCLKAGAADEERGLGETDATSVVKTAARDALPRALRGSAELDIHKLFNTGFDADSLMQRNR